MGGTADCTTSAEDIITALTGDDSPLQDKDPYDGGKAVVSEAPDDDDGGPRGNVILSDESTTDAQIIKLTTAWNSDASEELESEVQVSD